MNLTQLRLFRDIAREMSFIKAADQNHISQPAVSMQIRKLEESLGKKLLVRSPHNIQLTPEGRLILGNVKEILALCDGIKRILDDSEDIVEGDIRIAAIHSIGMYEIGETLSTFMKSYPKVHIHLEYQRSDVIYDRLLKEKIDIGLVAYPEKRARIESITYGHDELVVIAANSHSIAARKSITLEQIRGEPFIAFDEGIPTREATDSLLKAHDIAVDLRMTNDNIYTLKKSVEADIGVSIVPSSAVEEEVLNGSLKRLRIKAVNTQRELAMVKLKKKKTNRPLEKFIQTMLELGDKSI